MKKIALLLLVAAIAASPAAAASKHKKPAKQQESEFAKQGHNTLRILRDGAPLVLPSYVLPIYFGTGMDTTQKPAAKPHKVAKAKKM